MATFPATLPDPSIVSTGTVQKAQVRTPFEGGYVQSRAKYTRKRRMFEITLAGLDNAQFATFETFFDDNQGGMWEYPFFDGTFRFSGDEFDFNWPESGVYRNVTFAIEEV